MGLSEIHGEIPIQPVVPHQFSHQHYVYRGFPQSYTYHLGTVYGIEWIPHDQLSLLNATFIIFYHR